MSPVLAWMMLWRIGMSVALDPWGLCDRHPGGSPGAIPKGQTGEKAGTAS